MRNRFVIGAGYSYGVGYTGGEETHMLTVNEMPSHVHSLNVNYSPADPISSSYNEKDSNFITIPGTQYWGNTITKSGGVLNSGGSAAHNNMPPYYALCYIMKTA